MADIYDYKPNSHAYKREQTLENKKIEKGENKHEKINNMYFNINNDFGYCKNCTN